MGLSFPRRSFEIQVEKHTYKCKELSIEYIDNVNRDENQIENVLLDSIGEIPKEHLSSFGRNTKLQMYTAILDFTFPKQIVTDANRSMIKENLSLSDEEMTNLSDETLLPLLEIVKNRLHPVDENEKKKS